MSNLRVQRQVCVSITELGVYANVYRGRAGHRHGRRKAGLSEKGEARVRQRPTNETASLRPEDSGQPPYLYPHYVATRLRVARGALTLEDEAGETVMIEATTSWSYVRSGPAHPARAARARVRYGVQHPQYWLKVFLSRNVTGAEGARTSSRSKAPSRA